MFEIDIEQQQNAVPVTILRLVGSFDTGASEVFNSKIKDVLGQGAGNILVDLAGLQHMSSVGISALMSLYYALHPKSSREDKDMVLDGIRSGEYTAPHLKLLKPSKEVFKVIQTTGLDMILEIYKSEKKALKSF
jgi:anti-anti-sigma factor